MNQVQEQATATAEANVKSIDPCHWCQTNAGRTQAARKCCQLRALALSPRHAQAEYAKGLSMDEKNALRPVLTAEIERLKGLA